jgi:heme A synthase
MMRELEPGLIVSAVVCLILILDLNYGIVTLKLDQYKVFEELYPWLISSAFVLWSLFIHEYWGIFVFASFLTLLIIEKYEKRETSAWSKTSTLLLLIGTLGVAGINTLATLYILTKYFKSS